MSITKNKDVKVEVRKQKELLDDQSNPIDPISVPGIMVAMIEFQMSESCEDYFKIIYRAGSLAKVN